MSRWSSVLPGRGRRSGSGSGSGTGRRGAPGPDGGASGAVNRGAGGPPVEDVDGVLLVRSVEDDSFPLDVVAEVAGAGARRPSLRGCAPGANRHQADPAPESPWAKSVPPGVMRTAPSGAVTSSSQASAILRATLGRSGRSTPAPDMTSRTLSVPRSRRESSSAPSRAQ